MKYFALLGLAFIRADQPIKCPKTGGDFNYVGSQWTFHTTQTTDIVDLYQTQEVCGHQMPNKVQLIADTFKFNIPKERTWNVKFLDEKNVEAIRCPKGKTSCIAGQQNATTFSGTWDILFKQSLVVELQNNQRFIANFEYTLMPATSTDYKGKETTITADPVYEQGFNNFAMIKDHDFDRFYQRCDKTMMGFVQKARDMKQQMNEHHIQCFYAEMQQQDAKVEEAEVIKPDEPLDLKAANLDVQVQEQNMLQIQTSNQIQSIPVAKINLAQEHKPSQESDILISWVNSNPHLGWKANTCMLQKQHPDHCSHNKEVSFLQIQDDDDEPAQEEQKLVSFGSAPQFKEALAYVQKFHKMEDIPSSKIPEKFDLSNIMGNDFTGKVRDQKGCASCYTMSFIQVLESRLLTQTGKDIGGLSAQHMMQCNYLTEGCSGGWAIMDGYLAETGGVVSEECAPYLAMTRGKQCSDYSSCPTVAKVKRSYQLDSSDRQSIKKELLKNGALVTDWYMPPYAKTYKTGVFGGSGGDAQNLMFSEPNHASALIGWGKQGEQEYWILRNSFGQSFGKNGNINVLMENFGVENNLYGFEPILIK